MKKKEGGTFVRFTATYGGNTYFEEMSDQSGGSEKESYRGPRR